MTIAKSLLNRGSEFYVDGFPQIEEPEPTASPRKYPVMLQRKSDGEFFMGHVVTFMDLLDWCDMKGYELIDLYAGTRVAYSHERTDLR